MSSSLPGESGGVNHSEMLDTVLPRLRNSFGANRVRQQLEALTRHGTVVDDPVLWLETALARDFKFMPIETVSECACGSDESTAIGRFVFWNLLGVRRCDRCGVMFVSPRLTREAMERVFNESYFRGTPPSFWGVRREPVFADVGRLLFRLGCRTVFDVGAAYGHFLAYARDLGISGAGCDLSRTAVKWGREVLGVELHHASVSDLGLCGSSFDAAISLDTLYYSADPLRELAAMRRLVKPGGWVVLRLRNGLWSLLHAQFQRRRRVGRPVAPAEHLWMFPPSSLPKILVRAGLELVSVQPAAYSRSVLSEGTIPLVWINRVATAVRIPILTLSYTAVARHIP